MVNKRFYVLNIGLRFEHLPQEWREEPLPRFYVLNIGLRFELPVIGHLLEIASCFYVLMIGLRFERFLRNVVPSRSVSMS